MDRRWVFPLVAVTCTASCVATRATDGSVGGASPGGTFSTLGDGLAAALATSAAKDTPCSRSDLSLVSGNGSVYTVQGCGQRVTYSLNYTDDFHDYLVLVGRTRP